MAEKKQILIGRSYLEEHEDKIRLCSDIRLPEETFTMWIEVRKKYGSFIADDREDGFLVALLPLAMRENMDIVCEGSISRRLLYQLNGYLLPILADNMEIYHPIRVKADATDPISVFENRAAATGWTGGVDSMYTLYKMKDAAEPGMRLTHLLIANNGALESDHNEDVLEYLVKRAEDHAAKECGLEVIGVNSNLDRVLHENYLAVAGYRLPALSLALQKGISVFYNSAAYEYSRFAFVAENSAYYEMILFQYFSTEAQTIYSTCASVSRLQKLKELSDYPLAQKYLHPCIYAARDGNCGNCGKCIRTETALYALGTLDRFSQVFDTEYFYENKDRYIANIIFKKASQHYGESYVLMKQKGMITKRAEQLARMIGTTQKVAKSNQEKLEALKDNSSC